MLLLSHALVMMPARMQHASHAGVLQALLQKPQLLPSAEARQAREGDK